MAEMMGLLITRPVKTQRENGNTRSMMGPCEMVEQPTECFTGLLSPWHSAGPNTSRSTWACGVTTGKERWWANPLPPYFIRSQAKAGDQCACRSDNGARDPITSEAASNKQQNGHDFFLDKKPKDMPFPLGKSIPKGVEIPIVRWATALQTTWSAMFCTHADAIHHYGEKGRCV